ncbi:fructose bisphosphate aldolase [Isachenkonia alkalipeptolytica]|uniref:fructose-bisphosphate aldolase n=1 Tax=Isachenkonia alkalipeptolytica TaxID=2565777 RepID=A0AA44BDQ0_9CLOT|nr:fructose bisphosphate aldolase [Isachenkonia alkalipeptolytica]
MKNQQKERIRKGGGFIAALDQSGGSTPKALAGYGIKEDAYSNEEEMFDLVHGMRSRIMTSPSFTGDKILGVILFEKTMDREVEGMMTPDYLWEKKGIVSFLKVDKGMEDLSEGVQLMKPIPGLEEMLQRAQKRNIFGTKMRSVIKEANATGIEKIVSQQFEYGKEILDGGLMPILEPEIDIHSPDKEESEKLLKEEILKYLNTLGEDQMIMLKLSIPSEEGFYSELVNHPKVLRVVALSGGYSRDEAVELLAKNPGVIASFSRALLEGLSVEQSDEIFDLVLRESIDKIYQASIQ